MNIDIIEETLKELDDDIIDMREALTTIYQRGREDENNAWLGGYRCHTCGEEVENSHLSDTCSRCFEEE